MPSGSDESPRKLSKRRAFPGATSGGFGSRVTGLGFGSSVLAAAAHQHGGKAHACEKASPEE
jgi:hypothetical protein